MFFKIFKPWIDSVLAVVRRAIFAKFSLDI